MLDLHKDKNTVTEADVIDVTMKEIASVSEENTKAIISLEDVESTIKTINEMNFVEVNQFSSMINGQLANLQGAKTLIDAISGIKEYDETNRLVAINNVLEQAEYKESVEEFVGGYEINNARLTALKEASDNRIAFYENITKNTTFMNDQMIESIDKRIERIKEKAERENVDASDAITQLENIRNVFANRYDYTYLDNKSNIAYTIKGLKNDYKNKNEVSVSKLLRHFCKFFTKNQMLVVEKYIAEQFNDDLRSAHIFLMHLSKLIINDNKNSNFTWVKVFIMNILDTHSEIMDKTEEIDNLNNFIKSVYPKYKY